MQIGQLQKLLKGIIGEALRNASRRTPLSEDSHHIVYELEIPKDLSHGDLTTNLALKSAKFFGLPPKAVSELLVDEIKNVLKHRPFEDIIGNVEPTEKGFINLWLKRSYLYNNLHQIRKKRNNFGRNNIGHKRRVNIEFVSANPTGPLTVAHGRQAAVGDALSRILAFSGYRVCREYFINDVGVQIILLAESIYSQYLTLFNIENAFPRDGYAGGYIVDIAREIAKRYGRRFTGKKGGSVLDFFARFGIRYILDIIKNDLKQFGVNFDVWYSQSKISDKKIRGLLNKLKEKGYIYQKDGALWFRSQSFGDDKDRVVIKRDGSFTYLAPDIVYHREKFRRGFDRVINIWGPDHHGYIKRLVASVEALGFDRERISILIVQLATLYRNGVALSMSTRKGEFITLREVIDEVGRDVARFFFLMRKLDSHLDFDLTLAKKTSLDNPVYYIQYAHARIASIMDYSRKIKKELNRTALDLTLLDKEEEMLLLRVLAQFPLVVSSSAVTLEPYRLVLYLNELAKIFHNFYTKYKVVSVDAVALSKARLYLVTAVKQILANGLGLLGVSIPERM